MNPKRNRKSHTAEFLQCTHYTVKQFQDFTALQALPQSKFAGLLGFFPFLKRAVFQQAIFKHIIPTANASNLEQFSPKQGPGSTTDIQQAPEHASPSSGLNFHFVSFSISF